MTLLKNLRIKIALALLPEPEERTLSKKEADELIGTIDGSKSAAELFKRYMELFNIKVIDDERISRGTWHYHIITLTNKKKYIITFKRYWMHMFDKVFKNNNHGEKGTGLNSKILKRAKKENINEAIIVRSNGEMYLLDIKKLLNYTDTYGSIREEKGEFEFHCPIWMLKKILTISEQEDEIDEQIKKVYPEAKI